MTPSEKILQKTLVTSGLDSSQWNEVQAGMRDRAFFSSRVESAKFIYAARSGVSEIVAANKSPSEIRRDLRKLLDGEGYTAAPGSEGSVQDLRSQSRLDLIIQTNARQARGYVQLLDGNTPGALMAFPGQELIRTRQSKVQRDWSARWQAAGGRLFAGRMIALKSDPVWYKISRFNVPWPPFDFGSGMGVQDLDRTECVQVGLIQPDDPPPAPIEVPGFNSALEAEVPFAGTNDPESQWLKDSFGDQVVAKQGKIQWANDIIRKVLDSPSLDNKSFVSLGKAQGKMLGKCPDDIRAALDGKQISLQPSWIHHLYTKGHVGDEREDDPRNIKLQPGDFDLLGAFWRDPDSVTPGKNKDTAKLELETFDGGVLTLIVENIRFGLRPNTFYKRDKKKTAD